MEKPSSSTTQKVLLAFAAATLALMCGCQKASNCTPCATLNENGDRIPNAVCSDDEEYDFKDYQRALADAQKRIKTIPICGAVNLKPGP